MKSFRAKKGLHFQDAPCNQRAARWQSSARLNLALLLVKAVTLQRNVNSSAERNYFPHLTSACSKDDSPYKAPLFFYTAPELLFPFDYKGSGVMCKDAGPVIYLCLSSH